MDGIGIAAIVLDDAVVVGCLDDDACHAVLGQQLEEAVPVGLPVMGGNGFDGEAVEAGIGVDDAAYPGVNGLAHQHMSTFLAGSHGHHGSFGSGGGTVVH